MCGFFVLKVYDQLMYFIYGKDKPTSLNDKIYNHDKEGFIGFIDAPGGTGKTYGLNTFLNYARSRGDIALASAFSGVAALLLTGGNFLYQFYSGKYFFWSKVYSFFINIIFLRYYCT